MNIIKKTLSINSKNYLKPIAIINSEGGRARLVGGAVRDALLDIYPSDIDIATDLQPHSLLDLFARHKLKAIPTGIKFGTISIIIEGEIFEITTLRKDIHCDGRRAIVEYSQDFMEDAQRRDFTINALSYCPVRHEIYDYFGGIEDLKNRRVVFIGSAEARIVEDYLRILRFFRFSCRFANKIDEKGLEACILYKDKLLVLSRERIKTEIDAILPLEFSSIYLEIMDKCEILQVIFPVDKFDNLLFTSVKEVARTYKIFPSVLLLYGALLIHSSDISIEFLLKLKFSKNEAKRICDLIKFANLAKNMNELRLNNLLLQIWLEDEVFAEQFALIAALLKCQEFIYNIYWQLCNRAKPIMPITSQELMDLGINGKALGSLTANLKQQWIGSNFSLTKIQLLELAKKNDKNHEK